MTITALKIILNENIFNKVLESMLETVGWYRKNPDWLVAKLGARV